MKLIEMSYESAMLLLKLNPSCDNYLDSLISQSADYLERYRFFKNVKNEIFGISPENNVHLYSEDDLSLTAFFNLLKSEVISPGLFFHITEMILK